MDKILILLYLSILLSGCQQSPEIELPAHLRDLENLTVYSGDTEPVYNIEFIREQVFGDSEDVFFQRMGDVLVQDNGRVLISESAMGYRNLYVFNPDGSYLTNIGREGSGPGEYETPSHLQIKSNQLHVYDNLLKRLSVFSLDSYSFLDAFVPVSGGSSGITELEGSSIYSIQARSRGDYLIGYEDAKQLNIERSIHYYLVNQQGNIASGKIQEQKGEMFYGDNLVMVMPRFNVRPLVTVTNDDRIFFAQTDDILIRIHAAEGTYVRAFYYPFSNVAFNREDYLGPNPSPGMERIDDLIDYPDTWPAMESMLLDDENRIWISTIVNNQEIYEWWVLEETGELIARFQQPRDRMIEVVRDGSIYIRETDEESGLQTIVRYRIEMEEV